MNWWDAIPGSGLTVRPAIIDDVGRVIDAMSMDTFLQHFEHQTGKQARLASERWYVECTHQFAIERETGGVVYLVTMFPLPAGYDIRGMMWGLPGVEFPRYAGRVAHWLRRRFLAHARQHGMVPLATAIAETVENERWLRACGGEPGEINGRPVMMWGR